MESGVHILSPVRDPPQRGKGPHFMSAGQARHALTHILHGVSAGSAPRTLALGAKAPSP